MASARHAARTAVHAAGWATLSAPAVGLGVLAAEIALAATRGYLPADSAPAIDEAYGRSTASPLRLAVLGDSTAAGVGVRRGEDTVAVRLAHALAREGRRVIIDGVAISGSRAGDLGLQVSRALAHGRPQVALVLVGVNDATRLTSLSRIRTTVGEAAARLRSAGAQVVVGTCPDLGALRAYPHPLRELVAWRGRRVAAAQTSAVTLAGGAAVDLAGLTGPVFRADPGTLAEDAFHPSADGYRVWAEALLPAVRQAAVLAEAPNGGATR